MTDNEIIKALECCINDDCEDCPLYGENAPDVYGNCAQNTKRNALDLINRQKAEIINRTEEYNDMVHQRNKVEEALELKTMDVNSLESERDALQEMVKEQKAEIETKDTEIDILIRKKEALRDEVAEKQAELERLQCSAKRNGRQIGSLIYHLEQAKSEAYREFAERLKPKKFTHKNFGELVYAEDIDTTLEELTRNLHGTCTESNE